MKKIQLAHKAYSIDDLKRLLDSKKLIIQPKYQRRRTKWPLTAKTGLIDTILQNYPIPSIYLRETLNERHQKVREVIDGQQRIATIMEFVRDEFALHKNLSESEYIGYRFSELPYEIQQEIEDYALSFVSIRGASDSDIIAIFSRVNSFSLPGNAQEKRNALYTGQFKSLVYELSANYYTFWSGFKVLSDAEIARMEDAQLVSEILTTIMLGFEECLSKGVDNMYKKLDNEFPASRKYYEAFNRIMTIIGHLFENKVVKSDFHRKAWFFSLFLAIYQAVFGELKKPPKNPVHLDTERMQDNLVSFSEAYTKDKVSPDIKRLFQQGTGSNRLKRNEIMMRVILEGSHAISYLKYTRISIKPLQI